MEAYCKEVCRLEDKFHGLELVHVARRYNEAADELAKIASTRGTVPPDAFSRDLHEPSVDLRLGGWRRCRSCPANRHRRHTLDGG